MKKVKCPDCKKSVIPEKDYCHIHQDCKEYSWICPNCESLNVDWLVRRNLTKEDKVFTDKDMKGLKKNMDKITGTLAIMDERIKDCNTMIQNWKKLKK